MANNFPDQSVEWHRHLSLRLPRELRELWEGSCESPNCPIKTDKLKIWSGGTIGDGTRFYFCALMNSYLGSPQLVEPFCPWNLLPAEQVSSIFNNLTRRNSTRKMSLSLYNMPTAPFTSLLSLRVPSSPLGSAKILQILQKTQGQSSLIRNLHLFGAVRRQERF